MAHPQIAVFARLADGGARPVRKLEGQKTMLGRTMHGISYDPANDEIFVPQPFGQSILVFRGNADGEEAPIRVLQGPLTNIQNPDKVEVDPVHNEIFVPDDDKILVFARDAKGNTAPIRVLEGPDTMLGADALAVDPIHDRLIVTGWEGQRSDEKTFVLIFNRTDQGNVKPRGIIRGPKTQLSRGTFSLRAYPPKGYILVAISGPSWSGPYEDAAVGVWHIDDNGDVPPRWTIGGPRGMLKQPRGIDVDPKNKSIIISDKVVNAVLTYHFPEIF